MSDATPFPEPIARHTQGYRFHELARRTAPSVVVIASKPGQRSLVLKIGPNLGPEAERLRWLHGRLPVPAVRAFASEDGTHYLLMTKLPGIDGSDERINRTGESFVALLAQTLRTIHALPVGDCPFIATTDDLLEIAEQRVRDGLLRADDFSARYLGRSPRALLDDLRELRPPESGAVFTHGDPSLPNFLVERGQLSGVIDLGLAGVSDPYRDLATAAESLTRNMGGKWVRPFFEAYGAVYDERRIAFFNLLDEFVGAPPLRGSGIRHR